MTSPIRSMLLWVGLWAVLIATALLMRGPLPVDETRYMSAAWDMWIRGDFLVPYLNGEPYSHKPPLLFWLMQAGWAAFGVNDWWPRLVAPTFGLAALGLTALAARRLWPDQPKAAALAPLLVLGSLFWTLFTTMTMFDMLQATWGLVGLLGVISAWRSGGRTGFVVLGVAIGLGVIAKGPVILLYTLPGAVLAPWWDRDGLIAARPGGFKAWYAGVGLAFGVGVALALAWAAPAAIFGGEAYRDAILWGQTAGRMVDSFAHQKPLWWYVALLPVLLLPWPLFPPLWRAGLKAWRNRGGEGAPVFDSGARLALCAFAPAFVVFSFISGKQPHYMLPLFPALGLLGARLLTVAGPLAARRWDQLPSMVLGVVLALAMGVLLVAGDKLRIPASDHIGLAVLWAAPLLAGVWLLWRRADWGVPLAAAFSVLMIVSFHGVARPVLAEAYDLRPLARFLAERQAEGWAVANYGKYHAQYQFLGRLKEPVDIIGDAEVDAWLAEHGNKGLIIAEYKELRGDQGSEWAQLYRGDALVVWDARLVREDKAIARKPREVLAQREE